MANPNPAPGRATRLAGAIELLEQPIEIARRNPRPAIGHLDHDRLAVQRGRHLDRRARRRVPGRILQQVHQHLLHQQIVHRHKGQIGGDVGGDRVTLQLPGQTPERGADHLFHRLPLLPHLQRAGLQPGHVEQIGHQPIQPLALVEDRSGQLAADFGVQRRPAIQQRAAGPGNHRKRRAQVVRNGAQQRTSQPLGLDVQADAFRLGRQLGPLHGQGHQARKRFQQMQLLQIDECRLRRSCGSTPSTPTVPREVASGK